MRITAIVCMLLLPAACRSGAGPNVTDGASVPPDAVAVETRAFPEPVASLLYSGVPHRRRDVIRSAAAWERLWSEITAEVTPRPALPAVDFAQEEVIVAAMGTKPSGGFAIAVDGVHDSEGRRFVTVRETSPGASCGVTGALTSPLAAVRVARSSGPVTFVEKSEVRTCD